MYPFPLPTAGSTFASYFQPWMTLSGRRWSSFRLCGFTGFLLAVVQAIILAKHLRLACLVLVGIVGTTILTFLALAFVTKILVGQERITYYHHEVSDLVVAVLFLRLSNQPVLPYLDVIILGVGLFLACGRLGCTSVGCCHGRPWRWGVKYNDEHAQAGFPSYLVGVRLFPVQALESFAVLLIVATGVAKLLQGSRPGAALAWYVMTYGVVRFCLEFVRGDAVRPYWLGFSEAQWTTLVLMLCIVWAEYLRLLPLRRWHLAVTLGVAAAVAVIMLIRLVRRTPLHLFLQPRHVKEFAEAIARVSAESPNCSGGKPAIQIAHTSLGIRISAGLVPCGLREVRHYTLSSSLKPITAQAARRLSNLILCLRFPAESAELLETGDGVFHCLINLPTRPSS